MKVAKWGNSLAVRLPADLASSLSLREGDEVELQTEAPGVLKVSRKKSADELIDELRIYRGRMPKNFKFDRDEANER
jgi:antitoxin MazE